MQVQLVFDYARFISLKNTTPLTRPFFFKTGTTAISPKFCAEQHCTAALYRSIATTEGCVDAGELPLYLSSTTSTYVVNC